MTEAYIDTKHQWESRDGWEFVARDIERKYFFKQGMLRAAQIAGNTEDKCYAHDDPCKNFNASECPDKSTVFCAIEFIKKEAEEL
jgi:hypothetical protein